MQGIKFKTHPDPKSWFSFIGSTWNIRGYKGDWREDTSILLRNKHFDMDYIICDFAFTIHFLLGYIAKLIPHSSNRNILVLSGLISTNFNSAILLRD